MKECITGKTSGMNSPSDVFPEITTQRCLLRKIVAADQQQVFEGLSHPEVIRYYGVSYNSFEATGVQMRFYDDLLENETGIWWAITQKETGVFLGACGLNNWSKVHRRAEIGFWLLPAFQGKGYMSESVKAVINHGFAKMNLHRIEAIVETGNDNSADLLVKLGFIYEGTHRECEIKAGKFIDLEVYALITSSTIL